MNKLYFRRAMRTSLSLILALLIGGVACAQAPVNDDCSGAIPLAINLTCISDTGDFTGANWQSSYPTMSCFPDAGNPLLAPATDIWYQFTPASGQTSVNITFVYIGSIDLIDQILTSSDNTCSGTFSEIACVDGYPSPPNSSAMAVIPGTTYFLRVVIFGNTSTSNTFTVCVQENLPLPVHISKLEGSLLPGGRASLTWQTYSEQNNAGFEVQRSADGRTFHKVGWVGTQARNGNSSQALSYRFADKDAVGAIAYYRLQQVDKDGKTTLSDIVRLGEQVKGSFGITAAPNPVSNNMVITTQGTQGDHARLTLTDITGKPVLQLLVTGAQTAVDMSSLSQGLYLLRYTDDNHKETLKISKQ